MHKLIYSSYTRMVKPSFVAIILLLTSISTIILFSLPASANLPCVGTFESDFITEKTTFHQGEIVFGQGANKVPEHYKLRIRDPSDNVTFYSNPVFDNRITCSFALGKDAPLGEWEIQKGIFFEGIWHWDYTANFVVIAKIEYTIIININGSGTIIKSPGQDTYINGTSVTLKAKPDPGWIFDYWSDNLSGSENPTTISMIGNKEITAHFKKESTNGGGTNSIKKNDESGNNVENIPPIANISVGDLYQGFVNSEIIFSGSLSYDPDGYIVSWGWGFGDENVSDGEIVNHSYSSVGEYTVILTITDNNGSTNISQKSIYIIKPSDQLLNPEINSPIKVNKDVEEPVDENSAVFILTVLASTPILALLALVPLIPFMIFRNRNKNIEKENRKKSRNKK